MAPSLVSTMVFLVLASNDACNLNANGTSAASAAAVFGLPPRVLRPEPGVCGHIVRLQLPECQRQLRGVYPTRRAVLLCRHRAIKRIDPDGTCRVVCRAVHDTLERGRTVQRIVR